jgi:hypothetical protein
MKMALMIIDGALEQCSKDSYKVTVAIVDKGRNLFATVRRDGTNPHTMDFARLKAYTSRTRGQTSLEVQKLMEKPENARINRSRMLSESAAACRSKLVMKQSVASESLARLAARRMRLVPTPGSPKWPTA